MGRRADRRLFGPKDRSRPGYGIAALLAGWSITVRRKEKQHTLMPRLTAGALAIALVATACTVEPIEDPGIGAAASLRRFTRPTARY